MVTYLSQSDHDHIGSPDHTVVNYVALQKLYEL